MSSYAKPSSRSKAAVAQPKLHHSELDCKVSLLDLLNFLQIFYQFISAGIAFQEALEELAATMKNKKLAKIISVIADDVRAGKPINESFHKFPKAFSIDVRALMDAATESANWTGSRTPTSYHPGILEMMIERIKRKIKLKEDLISQLTYPVFVIGFCFLAVVLLSVFVLPGLQPLFDAVYPPSKQGFLTISLFATANFFRTFWYFIPPFFITSGLGIYKYFQSPGGKKLLHPYLLKLPIISSVFIKLYRLDFCDLFATLEMAGISVQRNLKHNQASCRNVEVAAAIELAAEYVRNGFELCEALRRSHWVFDDIMYQITRAGERSGNLDNIMMDFSKQLYSQVEHEIQRIVKGIEPIAIVIMGLVVGFIVITFYQTMFSAVRSIASF